MAYCTVSIGSGLVDGLYGKSQFPIKSYLEKRGEAFEERSILKKLFRMETSKHWAEPVSYTHLNPVLLGIVQKTKSFLKGICRSNATRKFRNAECITAFFLIGNHFNPVRKIQIIVQILFHAQNRLQRQ